MVKISLSLLTVALATVTAAPFSAQHRFICQDSNRCLPGIQVKENQPFHLLTFTRLSHVSTFLGDDLLIEGADDDKAFTRLQFCMVSRDEECTETSDSCILEGTEYRVRVHGPEKGYLRSDGYNIRIVEGYGEASDVSLIWETGGIRITTKDHSGDQMLFTAIRPRLPIRLDMPESTDRQLFKLEPAATRNQLESNLEDRKCLPETLIKEYNPFQLFSYDLDNYVSKKVDNNLLLGGLTGDKSVQLLQFCVVSSDRACTAAIPTDCIYQNAPYRVRVQGPTEGYLRVSGGLVDIVKRYDHASVLSLFKEDDWGLRIGYVNSLGEQYVFATTAKGKPIVLEPLKKEKIQQFFDLTKPKKENRY